MEGDLAGLHRTPGANRRKLRDWPERQATPPPC